MDFTKLKLRYRLSLAFRMQKPRLQDAKTVTDAFGKPHVQQDGASGSFRLGESFKLDCQGADELERTVFVGPPVPPLPFGKEPPTPRALYGTLKRINPRMKEALFEGQRHTGAPVPFGVLVDRIRHHIPWLRAALGLPSATRRCA